jgi:DNA-binding transcriptional MerR regulator
MTMTVGELKQILEDLDDDVEVRIAQQPRWPFEYSIGEVITCETNGDDIDECEAALERKDLTDDERAEAHEELERFKEDNKHVVYIAEREQIGYLPGNVTKALGWGR